MHGPVKPSLRSAPSVVLPASLGRPPVSRQPLICFRSLQIRALSLEAETLGIIQRAPFPWLLSLSVMILRSIHVVCSNGSLRPMWGSNSRPQDRESHLPPTEPTRHPSKFTPFYFWVIFHSLGRLPPSSLSKNYPSSKPRFVRLVGVFMFHYGYLST